MHRQIHSHRAARASVHPGAQRHDGGQPCQRQEAAHDVVHDRSLHRSAKPGARSGCLKAGGWIFFKINFFYLLQSYPFDVQQLQSVATIVDERIETAPDETGLLQMSKMCPDEQ